MRWPHPFPDPGNPSSRDLVIARLALFLGLWYSFLIEWAISFICLSNGAFSHRGDKRLNNSSRTGGSCFM